jgi:GntR family transcriptional regulator of arabinose operon
MKDKAIPKYIQLKQEILSWIHSGRLKAEDQMPSEHEIAGQFQLSRQTVRQTLGELEKEGWLYRVQGRGTFVSEPKLGPRDSHEIKTIGMLTTYISDYIFPHIVRGAEAALRNRGYRLLLSSTDNDKAKESESLKMMMHQPLDGLIIEPTKSALSNTNLNYYLSLAYQQTPFVMINERYHEINCPVIKLDDEYGGFMAAEHLIQLGHKHIVGFFKTDDMQGINRLKGFIRAHQKYRVPLQPESVVHYNTEEKEQKPYQLALALLQSEENRPTAFVCYNDQLALLILEAVRQLGLNVPDDISLVGFDDSTLATAAEVKLTTLEHPKSNMGVHAAEMLIQMIEKRHQAQDIVYKPEIIVRESTRQL